MSQATRVQKTLLAVTHKQKHPLRRFHRHELCSRSRQIYPRQGSIDLSPSAPNVTSANTRFSQVRPDFIVASVMVETTIYAHLATQSSHLLGELAEKMGRKVGEGASEVIG